MKRTPKETTNNITNTSSPYVLDYTSSPQEIIIPILIKLKQSNYSIFLIDNDSPILGKFQLLERISALGEFPDYFGFNWSALEDCLSDFTWLPSSGYIFIMRQAHYFMISEPESFLTFKEIMEDSGKLWANEGILFKLVLANVSHPI